MPESARPAGMRVIFAMILRHPRALFFTVLLGFLAAAVITPVPYLGKIIIDDIIFRTMGLPAAEAGGFMGIATSVWMLGGVVLLGVALRLLGIALQGWQSWFILHICRNSLYRLRLDLAERLMGAPSQFFESFEPGRAAARLSNDVNQIDNAIITVLRSFLGAILTAALVVCFMVMIDARLTAVVLVAMPLTALLAWYSHHKLHTFNHEEMERNAKLSADSTEIYGAMKLVRAFTAEAHFLDRIRDRSEAMRFHGIRHWTISHTVSGLLGLLSSLGGDIFLFVGGLMAMSGRITFGEFFAFYGYQAMLWGPLSTLLTSGQAMQVGIAAVEKADELLRIPLEPHLTKSAVVATGTFRGEVVAEGLGFHYHEGDEVLKDFTLHLRPGTMTALVGQSGSGKTTFANLLLGMYEPTAGRLLMDGVDIREWDLRVLRQGIGVVLQDATVFNDSVTANLCLGVDFDEERIWSALRAAHLADVVRDLPEGLATRLGNAGVRLSGGQRQRLAIARVFLRDPAFVILDEATSALDSETERAIQRSFDALLAGRTSVVIAHRLSTIVKADQIAVLHHGRLVEAGTHEQLAAAEGGHYRRLLDAQLEGMVPMSGVHRRPWSQP